MRRTTPHAPPGPAPRATIGEESALAAIVRSSHDAVIAKTVDGIITAWNDGASLLYGWPAASMIGRSIETIIPADALSDERARHERVAGGGSESGYRCVRLRADGSRVDVVMSMSPIRDDRDQVVGVASISRPVSDKERSDARFASLLAAAPDAIVCVDSGGLIATVNAQVYALFGYTPDELVGQPVEMLLPAEVHERHRRHQANFRLAPQSRTMGMGLPLSALRRDGSTFPVEVSLAPSTADGDEMVIAAIRDVTKLRAAEATVRESETLLRQLADNVETGFLLRQLDPPAYLFVSKGCDALFGLDAQLLMADPNAVIDLIHPDDRDRVTAQFLTPALAGLSAYSEHRVVRPDGSCRWIRAAASPVGVDDGRPTRTVIAVEDISDRVAAADALRTAEAAARAANDAKSEFLSRMSHELRTPLNAVLGFGQLLERQLDQTVYAEAVGHILRGGRHLLDLINDVLDIARIESGAMSLSVEPVAVPDLIAETVELMRPLADTAGVVMHADGSAGDLWALADRQRLRQIMLNLLSNAVKYNRRGGNVWITSAATATAEIAISVTDDGPGIPPALRERVFTPFDRLGAEGKGVEGTGIGLALTRSLSELMNGSVTLSSEAAGGCCFVVTVPLTLLRPVSRTASGHDAAAVRPTDDPPHPPSPRSTVLYIEDNEPNVRVVEHLLRLRPTWTLIHAGFGGLGIELAKAHHPDLILLDLHLPDGSGAEVLAALRSDPATADTPTAILSADANEHQIDRLIATGASAYLTKPLDFDEVLHLLDEVTASTAASRG